MQPTTLAQVAATADVAPGNVYYYFKTRDELVGAVIEAQRAEMADRLSRLDALATPADRLKGLAQLWADNSATIVEGGCPLGSLSHELSKTDSGLARKAVGCMRTLLDWSERQFRDMGVADPAADAFTMLASIQGASLLANALGDETLVRHEIARIEAWIATRPGELRD